MPWQKDAGSLCGHVLWRSKIQRTMIQKRPAFTGMVGVTCKLPEIDIMEKALRRSGESRRHTGTPYATHVLGHINTEFLTFHGYCTGYSMNWEKAVNSEARTEHTQPQITSQFPPPSPHPTVSKHLPHYPPTFLRIIPPERMTIKDKFLQRRYQCS